MGRCEFINRTLEIIRKKLEMAIPKGEYLTEDEMFEMAKKEIKNWLR